jgi:hypothetical protein
MKYSSSGILSVPGREIEFHACGAPTQCANVVGLGRPSLKTNVSVCDTGDTSLDPLGAEPNVAEVDCDRIGDMQK